MQQSDFKHFIELPVRWGDMDALGHVNNVEFFRYFESGRIAYIDSIREGRSISSRMVLADIECAFRRQLHYPHIVRIGTRIARIGNSSMHLDCAIFIKDDADPAPAAIGRAVIVWFDFDAQRATRVPDDIRAAIEAFEA